jgi:hypothetical protein
MKSSAHISLRPLLIFLIVPLIPVWGQNPIVVENQNAGSTNWNLSNSGSDAVGQIKGYASAASINKGESITFFVSVNPAQAFAIDVYRLGWYGGAGGRLMQHLDALQGMQQETCPTDPTLGTIVCTWNPSFTLTVPGTWTSGVFVAVLNSAAGFQNYIVFVVRDDSRTADLLYQLGVNTLEAYNNWPNDNKTGKSLYDYNSFGAKTITGTARAAKVSFDRPYRDDGSGGLFYWQLWDLHLIHWLEKNGYDVAYSTDLDTHLNGSRLLGFKGFISAGHDEYWSKAMYDNVQAARDNGVNLAFFGANAIYWQARYEPSAVGVPNRILVCYKDASLDPVQGSTTTVQWRDPLLNRPEQALMGVQFSDENGSQNFPYVVTNSSSWVYGNTGFTDGSSVPGIVGYEWDRFDSNYPAPPAVAGSWTLLGNSPTVTDAGRADSSNSSIYQAQSGAWVFATGTMSWSSGLSASGADPRIQQATTNVLNRFIAGSSSTPFTLTVTKSGTGTGTITSSPAGISCGSSCSATFDSGTVVNLTATPDSGSTFAGWSGACTGTGACSVTMDAAKSVGANFSANAGPFTLTVSKSGNGTGTVTSTPSGISCGTTCSASFASGTVVSLAATPDSGSTFAGWGGACSGTGACSVTMNSAQSVSATFNSNSTVALSALTVNPPSVVGGNSSTGTVTLTGAATANIVVALSSNNASASVPPSVTVPQGATSASFSIATQPVSSSTVANISAIFNGVTKTATLNITPATALLSLSLNPTTVVGGTSSTGTVTLSSAAPSTGITVQLSSNRTKVATVPSSVTIPAGATTANFSVSTSTVRNTSKVTISGTSAGVTKSAVLTVTP